MSEEQTPLMNTAEESSKPSRDIPVWVALAGMVLAIIVAIIIMVNVLEPLVNLIFPQDPEPPVPANAELISEDADSSTSSGEWLYGTDTDACQIAEFYIEEGSNCRFEPLACEENEDGELVRAPQVNKVATCVGTEASIVSSYSWEVIISGDDIREYETVFRLFLYEERQ